MRGFNIFLIFVEISTFECMEIAGITILMFFRVLENNWDFHFFGQEMEICPNWNHRNIESMDICQD